VSALALSGRLGYRQRSTLRPANLRFTAAGANGVIVDPDRHLVADDKSGHPQTSCVVFSKDRPLQLDAALASLDLCVSDLGQARVTVLYRASTPFFAAQYRTVGFDHPEVELRREADFKSDLLELVAGSPFVLFMVDDAIFVGDASLSASMSILEKDRSCLGFSFRLGRNTTYCYTMNKPQTLPESSAGSKRS